MVVPILIVLGIVLVLAVAAYLALPGLARRGMGGVRPADPTAAKALGDQLLAARDTTVCVFIAHPDDAEWWIGGTLGMLARRNRVVLVLGTSGESGNGGVMKDRLGPIREDLQRKGGQVLGYHEVVFLRHPDGGLADQGSYPAEVEEIVADREPSIVITFDTEREGPVYHHPDHAAAGRAALAAVRKRAGIDLYLFHSGAPDVIVDFEPVAEEKSKALSVLRSYHDASPFAWLLRALPSSRTEEAVSFGGRSEYPGVGVRYGEVLRKDVRPPK